MAGKKTAQERYLELEKDIQQKEERKKQLKKELNQQKRKQRTRRLIAIGAVVEKVLGKELEGNELAMFEGTLSVFRNEFL